MKLRASTPRFYAAGYSLSSTLSGNHSIASARSKLLTSLMQKQAFDACKLTQESTVAGCSLACNAQESKENVGPAKEANGGKRRKVQRIEVGPGVYRVEGLPVCAADEIGGDSSPVCL